MLSNVSVKSWQRNFQSNVSVKSRHQKINQKLIPKVLVKSWQRKFQSRVDSEIVREVALLYCKQINNGRYQSYAYPAYKKVSQAWTFSLRALLLRLLISKCQNCYFPTRTWAWCHVILIVVKTKQMPGDLNPLIVPTGPPVEKVTCIYLYLYSYHACRFDIIIFDYLWIHENHMDTHVRFYVDVHRHTGSSYKEYKYWNGNRHNMTKN